MFGKGDQLDNAQRAAQDDAKRHAAAIREAEVRGATWMRDYVALSFESLAGVEHANAARWMDNCDRLGRWHPARSSAGECKLKAARLETRARKIRTFDPARIVAAHHEGDANGR